MDLFNKGLSVRMSSRYLPKNATDLVAFVTVLTSLPAIFLFEVFVVFPNVYPRSAALVSRNEGFHILVVAFIAANFYCNFVKIILTDTSGFGSDLPFIQKQGFRYCYMCKLNAPPRSYHCAVCDRCILKRDHHSFMTSCCIGYFNHRYYLMLLAYVWLGCCYAVWLHWSYIWESIGGYSFEAFACIVFPQFALLLGQLSFIQFVNCCVQMSSSILLLFSSFLFGRQLYLIANGQTLMERNDGIRHYDMGLFYNFKDVLGERMLVAWIFPFIKSPLLSDGVNYFDKISISTKDV